MSANGRSVTDPFGAPTTRPTNELSDGASGGEMRFMGDEPTDTQPFSSGSGGPGSSRRKRRRQRSQRGKRRRSGQARPHQQLDVVNCERIFQELEGLLRQIREQAEESTGWAEERVTEMAQTVTAFTKSLEEVGDPVSERARSEYQRIREKLSQALKG